MKKINLQLLCAMIFTISIMCAGASGQDAKQPKFLIVNGLKEDMNYILSGKSPHDLLYGDQPGGISDYDVRSMQATQERAAKGLQKVKQLMDLGTAETEPIQLKDGTKTLGEISQTLLDYHREASMITLMGELGQAAMGTKTWVEDLSTKGKLDRDSLEVAVIQSKRLQKAVAEAKKLGFPADYRLNLYGQEYSLPELKEMAIYVETASSAQREAIEAARAAKDAPFLKALTGDKLRIFKEEFGGMNGEWLCIGSGGSALTTPETLKGATVWFTYGNSRGLVDTWHITGWRFQGDKLVGTVSKSGLGLKPPAAAFR